MEYDYILTMMTYENKLTPCIIFKAGTMNVYLYFSDNALVAMGTRYVREELFLSEGIYVSENGDEVIYIDNGYVHVNGKEVTYNIDSYADNTLVLTLSDATTISITNNNGEKSLVAQKEGNIVGDIVYIAASSAATWGVAALTVMIPVVGPFIAPIVGFGFGTAFDQFWHGEDIFGIDGFSFNPGGKSIDEWIKDFFTELFGG